MFIKEIILNIKQKNIIDFFNKSPINENKLKIKTNKIKK